MRKKVLLVGASTGGPSQIKEMLSQITSLSSTVIIVQHMREEVLPFFIKDLQDSLNVNIQTTPVSTTFCIPEVIICSHSSILKKNGLIYEIVTQTTSQKYTPVINILFNSFVNFSDDFELRILIMTGIGSDGVNGAKNLKEKGALIFAQDEKSCPVFGMPKAAIESGIVDEIKTIEDIKKCLSDF